jgi:tetratricopeptide (TPR) repeat protein
MPAAWVEALSRETSGNPFFLREVLLHLEEEGALGFTDGNAPPGSESLRLPESVRQVIARRLARLPAATTDLLRVAAAFTGGIDFEVARRVAKLDETPALDALDEALGAQLLQCLEHTYDFTHALVRHTLYDALSPARQARLHRQLAEAMQTAYGGRAVEHAAEIARHYHRSRSLPGAERGVPYCLAAADQAARASAFADVAAHLEAALDLLPATDPGRPRLMARRGVALAWSLRFVEAVAVANDAAILIAQTESGAAAAAYVVDVLDAVNAYGGPEVAGPLARRGLEYAGGRRDSTWAILKAWDIRDRELNAGGFEIDTSERREVTEVFEKQAIDDARAARPRLSEDIFSRDGVWWGFVPWKSRAEYLQRGARFWFGAGDYRRDLPHMRAVAEELDRQRKIGRAVAFWAYVARSHCALGEFSRAREARLRGAALAERLIEPAIATAQLVVAEDEWRMAMDEDWDRPIENVGPGMAQGRFQATVDASIARTHARMGRVERALSRLEAVVPIITQAPGWAAGYTWIACDAAETLWLTGCRDHIDLIARNLLEKVITVDFRFPMRDGRLALARVYALQGRYDEATDWFAKARTVLDEQGARPLRAIVDYDEALMYARRGAPGDPERARQLVDVALAQFRTLGMPGWIRRAEALLKSGAAGEQESEGALR